MAQHIVSQFCKRIYMSQNDPRYAIPLASVIVLVATHLQTVQRVAELPWGLTSLASIYVFK